MMRPAFLHSSTMARKLLVVEDDPAVRSFIVSSLEQNGGEILIAGSPVEARALLSDRADADDFCLVMDVVLEDESGIDYAQEVLKQHLGLRVLFISGYTDEVVVIEPEYAQRTAFLPKPFGRGDLLAALERLQSNVQPDTTL
jgi:two-component system, cell cycle sensor histidine kinase and response regulator CckA